MHRVKVLEQQVHQLLEVASENTGKNWFGSAAKGAMNKLGLRKGKSQREREAEGT
jgi:hypothetical protein